MHVEIYSSCACFDTYDVRLAHARARQTPESRPRTSTKQRPYTHKELGGLCVSNVCGICIFPTNNARAEHVSLASIPWAQFAWGSFTLLGCRCLLAARSRENIHASTFIRRKAGAPAADERAPICLQISRGAFLDA